MIRLRRHADLTQLLEFAEGELSNGEESRIAAHLAGCDRCAEKLAFALEVEHVAREYRPPAPPENLLDEILAFRARGGRVLLPTRAWSPDPTRPGRLGPVLAGLLILVLASALLFFLRTPEVAAGASELEVSTWIPAERRATSLEFRAASALAGEQWLRARGWYRGADDPPPRGTLGEYVETVLAAEGAGRFEGEVLLPPGAVYTALVVEDLDGTQVESNGHRLWEILARGKDGKPLFAALRQQFRVAEALQSSEALDIARRMTELYPDEPEGWFYRFVREQFHSPEAEDSLRRFHRQQLPRLMTVVLSDEYPAPERIAALVRYADRLGEDELAQAWLGRLEEQDPDHPAAVETRVLDAVRVFRDDPAALLRVLEAEWWRSAPASELLPQQGFHAALRAEDIGALPVWTNRYYRARPDLGQMIAEQIATYPSLASLAANLARRGIRELESVTPDSRGAFHTVSAERRERRREAARYLAQLGEILVAQGRVHEALDTLALAAEEEWDPDLSQRLAGSYLAAGDTMGALRHWARVHADPLAEPALAPARAALGSGFDPDQWDQLVSDARSEMLDRLVYQTHFHPWPVSWTLGPASQRPGRRAPAALVIYCAPHSIVCRRDFDRVREALRAVPEVRSRTHIILSEPIPASAFPELADIRVSYDASGDLPRALEDWRIPQYLLLDLRVPDRIRYASYQDLPTAYRALVLLLERASM